MRDLYRKLDREISEFIEGMSGETQPKGAMDQMVKTAKEIGGQLLVDVEKLEADYQKIVENPRDEKRKKMVAQDALKIKHEVREL